MNRQEAVKTITRQLVDYSVEYEGAYPEDFEKHTQTLKALGVTRQEVKTALADHSAEDPGDPWFRRWIQVIQEDERRDGVIQPRKIRDNPQA